MIGFSNWCIHDLYEELFDYISELNWKLIGIGGMAEEDDRKFVVEEDRREDRDCNPMVISRIYK